MKKLFTKLSAVSIAILMMTSSLTACGKKESESESYETWWTSESTEASSETEASTSAPTTSETTLAAPSEFAKNPLTGLEEMDAANVGKRGAAITINNCQVANPSRGTSEASVIFEYETEGGQTRLLCVFPDVARIPLLGSIRSGRVGAADMAAGTGAIFICWGSDETAVPSHVRKNNIDWIDINNNIFDSRRGHDPAEVTGNCFCWRDREWMNEPNHRGGIEHCGVSRGDFLMKAIDYYKIDIKGDMPDMFKFVESGSAAMAADSQPCSEINVYFSSTNDDALFTYNKDEKVYYKSQYNGKPQEDCNNDEQIHFTNVFVLYCPINPRPNDSSKERHKDIHLEEGGTGYYISYGKAEPITWTKPTPNDHIKCFDSTGKEIDVNAGKSYICVVDSDYMGKTTITP